MACPLPLKRWTPLAARQKNFIPGFVTSRCRFVKQRSGRFQVTQHQGNTVR